MRRHLVGIIAAASLIFGVTFFVILPAGGSLEQTAGVSIRVGLILGALWLALPQLARIPWWLYGSTLGGAVILARWPQLWWAVIPAVATMWIFRPKEKPVSRRP